MSEGGLVRLHLPTLSDRTRKVAKADHFMPLWIGDYLADTTHLSACEHGAYLLILMALWRQRKIPAQSRILSRIAHIDHRQWHRVAPTVMAFFTVDEEGNLRHGRLELERKNADWKHDLAAAKGALGGKAKALKNKQAPLADALAQGVATTTTVNSPPNGGGANGANLDSEKELFLRGRVVLGQNAGGLINRLLKAEKGEVRAARGRLEVAATKDNPKEWVAASLKGREPPEEGWSRWAM